MDVVCFGESLFRTSTKAGERLSEAQQLNFYLGGTELNLAANLKSLGVSSAWVSMIPAGLTGDLIKEKIKALGVDLSYCGSSSHAQVGWYLMESGAAPRPDVVYHRNSSALAKEISFSFDWSKILSEAKLFHSSGVTAGLSSVLNSEIQKAIQVAREKNILVSYDLNYRKNIWSIEDFVQGQKDWIGLCDILFCSRSDLKLFYGDDFEKNHFSNVFTKSKTQILVMSTRSEDQSEYGFEVISREKSYQSKKYKIQSLDRIGVGDSAAAGFLKVFLASKDLQKAADWAALAGALKYGIHGDMALLTEVDMQRVLESAKTGILR